MRIGIDARTLGGRFTGDRTYWRGLVQGLAESGADHEFFLYLREPLNSGSDTMELPANFTWRIAAAGSERVWSLSALPKAAKADAVDLMHVQYSVSPLFSMPVVTTVHDISFRLFPELFGVKDRLLLNLTVPAAVQRACRVIAVSENTRRDILTAYRGTSPEKVVAIPLAAGPQFRRFSAAEQESARAVLNETYGLSGPYALAVGVLQPRKNLPMLLKAFRAAKRIAGFPHRLAVTGKRGWLTQEIDDALSEGSGGEIVLTGYVPDEHLPLLYNCADLMCYPSLYEGFGLPPLEAMACGCPVLVSSAGSLPEVVGEAGVLLDPTRPGEWIDSIGRVLLDPAEQARLSESGLVQAAKFDWKRTASQTLAVYNACHNGL